MMQLIRRLFIIWFLGLHLGAATVFAAILHNKEAGLKFSEILINNLLNDVVNVAQEKRLHSGRYKANDLSAVQAIRSLEKSLFELSAYFAQNKTALVKNKYFQGAALEFSTTRCDSVVSNRFPRNAVPLPGTWSTHGDSVYYEVDCRRNSTDITTNQYSSLHAEIRVKRGLDAEGVGQDVGPVRNGRVRKSINGPSVCGSKVLYEGLSGNMTSPGYPGNYSAGISCVWHIKVPVKYAVEVTFDMFHLERDKRCLFDSVEFFDGSSTNSKSIGKFCGSSKPIGVRSSLNTLTIKMTTDNTIESFGFALRWNYTDPNFPHPGYIVNSNIVVDQVGPLPYDLNKFSLVFKKPTTCSLKSQDVYCYFQYESFIISRIIATTTLPAMQMNGQRVVVKFDHVIDLKHYPSLYAAKKYCVTWNDTILFTDSGSWTRKGGKIYRSDDFTTTCYFERPGIYAVIAEQHFEEEFEIFRFTGTFYAGIFFSLIWLIVLMGQWAFSRRINVPEWINFNQALSLVLFVGVVLCGLQLNYTKSMCSLLAFLLNYFGLGVFFWQFLKAAQLSGKFDDFFASGRNIYLFYFLLGWTLPMFIAGMAAGALFIERDASQSCWHALVGGTVWGYTSPAYFLVLANLLILYKVSKKTKKNLERFNHPELRKRILRELLQLTLYILTAVSGILSVLNKTTFSIQYMFCFSITLAVLLMSLGAKQRRPGYKKIHYAEAPGKDHEVKEKETQEKDDVDSGKKKSKFPFAPSLSMKAYKKWKRFKKYDLKLAKSFLGPSKSDSPEYKMYIEMEERSESKASVRTSTSVRSDSVLSTEKYAETSDAESELQMSSDEEDGRSSRASKGSRIEVKADVNVAGSRRSRATVGSQYQMRGDDDYNENGDTNEIINDPEHQNDDNTVSGSRASINPEAQINDHETPPNDGHHKTQPNDVQDESADMRSKSATEEARTPSERPLTREMSVAYSDKGGEPEEENRRPTGEEYQEGPQENMPPGESDDSAEEEEDLRDFPKITVNAFGGTPEDVDPGMHPAINRSVLSIRAHSAREAEDEAMSVCSLEEDDFNEQHNEENTEYEPQGLACEDIPAS